MKGTGQTAECTARAATCEMDLFISSVSTVSLHLRHFSSGAGRCLVGRLI